MMTEAEIEQLLAEEEGQAETLDDINEALKSYLVRLSSMRKEEREAHE